MKLRKEYDRFFLEYHNYYEGFAYWLEHYLAMQCGLEKYYDTKRESIHSHYVELSESFNDLVSKKGNSALLEKLGF